MGTVYLARNRLMGRLEVLKIVSGHLMNRRGVLERFLVEIRNAAALHHPNVVAAYSASRAGESIIFAMEYVEGLDLSKLVKAKGPLPVANACNYVHQAALALQHAHENGMVHRDIKPSNLMLSRQGNRPVIKVLDFGLAKINSEGRLDGGLTREGQMLGTPDYIAPEQISDARRADIRADIYSLGCTLYHLLTGGPPFEATSLYDILQAHHLERRDAPESHTARGSGRARRLGRQDDGQGAGAAVPGAEGGCSGVGPLLQEGRCGTQEALEPKSRRPVERAWVDLRPEPSRHQLNRRRTTQLRLLSPRKPQRHLPGIRNGTASSTWVRRNDLAMRRRPLPRRAGFNGFGPRWRPVSCCSGSSSRGRCRS